MITEPFSKIDTLDINMANIEWFTGVFGLDFYSGIVFYYMFGRTTYLILCFISVALIRKFL